MARLGRLPAVGDVVAEGDADARQAEGDYRRLVVEYPLSRRVDRADYRIFWSSRRCATWRANSSANCVAPCARLGATAQRRIPEDSCTEG